MTISNNIIIDIIAVVLIVVLIVMQCRHTVSNPLQKNINMMSAAIVSVFVFDICSSLLNGNPSHVAIVFNYIFCTLYFLAQAAYAFTWLIYIIKANTIKLAYSKFFLIFCSTIIILDILLVLLNLLTKWFFYIDVSGIYVRAAYYIWILFPFAICFACAVALTIMCALKESSADKRRQTISLLYYLAITVTGGILQIFLPDLPWLWVLASISLLLLNNDHLNQIMSEATIHHAIRNLGILFYRIYEFDLKTGEFSIIKADESESAPDELSKRTKNIWQLFTIEAQDKIIYPDDKEEFLRASDRNNLVAFFEGNKLCYRIKYRRLTGTAYNWVAAEFLKTPEFSTKNQKVILYVRDINDEYSEELMRNKQLELNINHDFLTGLHSRYCFTHRIEALQNDSQSIGIIYADLNSLKVVNDQCGHDAGDAYIKKFSDRLSNIFGHLYCYRVSGDEFAVIAEQLSHNQFDEQIKSLQNSLDNDATAMASYGSVWCEDSAHINQKIKEAEDLMYKNKDEFYSKNVLIQRRTFQKN